MSPGGLRRARLRVAAFVLTIGAVAAAGALTGSFPSSTEVRDFGESLGWTAVLLWIPVTVLLNSIFVPGPILAGAAGLMFGTAFGTPLAIAAATVTACFQMAIGRYLAGDEVGRILPERIRRIDGFLERRGFLAVLYIRLAPAIPYTLVNYSAGLTKLRFRDMAAGSAIGTAPRTFAYVALGGSIDNLGSPEAIAAIVLLVVIGLTGIVVGRRQIRAERA
ncbi:MAG: hypothetical protein QOG63_2891 [Thermoleophilaceae bacterium]|jgi:uncharacterized membrane protein YdjX (TVP38/TMEM64 family)|nr:hypothetical protein [Thermoleophilaceae bacterium]